MDSSGVAIVDFEQVSNDWVTTCNKLYKDTTKKINTKSVC